MTASFFPLPVLLQPYVCWDYMWMLETKWAMCHHRTENQEGGGERERDKEVDSQWKQSWEWMRIVSWVLTGITVLSSSLFSSLATCSWLWIWRDTPNKNSYNKPPSPFLSFLLLFFVFIFLYMLTWLLIHCTTNKTGNRCPLGMC